MKPDISQWKAIVARYQEPSRWRAIWQLVDTLIPYAALWYLMYLSLAWSHWITFGCAVLAGMFLVRIFIIFHDCGHGSFFKSRTANDIFGFITGVLTLTPYYHWRWEHNIHHASAGNLEKRGTGDIWTMTVEEYLESSPWKRLAYRLSRNPIVLFGLAPLFLFVVMQRFYSPKANPRERLSVLWMNLAIVAVAAGMSCLFGLGTYVLLQLTVTMIAGVLGVWMFYVQHQFEDVYWERDKDWDYTAVALKGSSFYKLPKVLQWFSGNIGFHHIHHLSPRIPNYNLERCHQADPLFQQVKPITLLSSLQTVHLRFWDERLRKLVGYRQMRARRKEAAEAARAERENGSPKPKP